MIDPTRKIIFVHPEKSGGTIIEDTWGARKLMPSVPIDMSEVSLGINLTYPYVYWPEQTANASFLYNKIPKEERSEWKTIGIVRNPGDRILSRHRYFLQADDALFASAKSAGLIDPEGIWPELLIQDIIKRSSSSYSESSLQYTKFDSGELDYLLRLENLKEDWSNMINALDLKGLPPELPAEYNAPKPKYNILHYVKLPTTRIQLAYLLRQDLESFGYGLGVIPVKEQSEILNTAQLNGTSVSDLNFLRRTFTSETRVMSKLGNTPILYPTDKNQQSVNTIEAQHIENRNKINNMLPKRKSCCGGGKVK